MKSLQVHKVLIGFEHAHVHLWIHVEGKVRVDVDHETLEPVLAHNRYLVNLFLRHVVELHLVPDEESDVEETF